MGSPRWRRGLVALACSTVVGESARPIVAAPGARPSFVRISAGIQGFPSNRRGAEGDEPLRVEEHLVQAQQLAVDGGVRPDPCRHPRECRQRSPPPPPPCRKLVAVHKWEA